MPADLTLPFAVPWLHGRDKTSLRATRGLETSALRFNTPPDPTIPQRCQAAGLRLRPPVCSVSILSDMVTGSFRSSAGPCAPVPTPSSELPHALPGKGSAQSLWDSDFPSFPAPLQSPASKCTPGDSRAGTLMGALNMGGPVSGGLPHHPSYTDHLFPTSGPNRDTSWEGWQGPTTAQHQEVSRCAQPGDLGRE